MRNYYAELTRAAQTGDTRKFKKLIHENCPCYAYAKVIDQNAARGELSPDASWTAQKIEVKEVLEGQATAEVHYEVGAYEVFDSTGERVDSFPERQDHLLLSLIRGAAGGWIVANAFNLDTP